MLFRNVIMFLCAGAFLCACGNADVESASTGERLARTHCSTCHLFPEPGLLDKQLWGQVLPYMGHRLGIYGSVPRDSLIADTDLLGVDTSVVFLPHPAVTGAEWSAIEAYYLTESLEELVTPPRKATTKIGIPQFSVRVPALRFSPPLSLLARIQPENRIFYVGNYGDPSLLGVISADGNLLFEWKLSGAPIRVHYDAGRLYVLLVGRGPEPSEASQGEVIVIDGPQSPPRTVLNSLKRPVDMEMADLNGDGLTDFVVCEYGHQAGFLSWYEAKKNGGYERRVLNAQPGAVQAVVHDFNGDEMTDIGVLMAQGDEGFDIYFNDGKGRFEKERKLRFPPVYGSNDIRLADFNADGRMDLLYVNGDNADITIGLKPYHGLRIYLAGADGEYEESAFVPMHGAVSARAGDFDEDGDLDIAAVSYFPDYARAPEEGFLYLENLGNLTFEPYTFADSQRGRWLAMDAGDFDGDNDIDILLASNIGFAPAGDATGLYERWAREAPSFVMLKNVIAGQ